MARLESRVANWVNLVNSSSRHPLEELQIAWGDTGSEILPQPVEGHGSIDPQLLVLDQDISHPLQATGTLPPETSNDRFPNQSGPIHPPNNTDSNTYPQPAPPEIDDRTFEYLLRQCLNLPDEAETEEESPSKNGPLIDSTRCALDRSYIRVDIFGGFHNA